MYPLITIVIPNYNYGHFLSSCIESVLKQDYKNWEMIVADDNSTDDSREIVRSYQQRYSEKSIRLIHLDDGPAGDPRAVNHAISMMNGDFFSWLSSDDMFMDGRLSAQVNFFNDHPRVGLVHCAALRLDGQGNTGECNWFFNPANREELLMGLFQANMINGNTVMIRKSTMEVSGLMIEHHDEYKDIWRAGDYSWWLKLAMYTDFGGIERPLHLARTHQGNSPFAESGLGSELQGLHLSVFSEEYPYSRMKDILPLKPENLHSIEAELWRMLCHFGYIESFLKRNLEVQKSEGISEDRLMKYIHQMTQSSYFEKCANLYWKMNDFQTCLNFSRNAWDLNAHALNMRVLYLQARCLQKLGRTDEARKYFQQIVDVFPRLYTPIRYGSFFQLAEISQMEGNSGQALEMYHRCLKENPCHSLAQKRVRELEVQSGSFNE